MQSNYRDKINASLKELYNTKKISSAILVCNTLLEYMGIEIKNVEDIELSKLKLPNAERYDRWFDPHPHFRGNRACFELTPKDKILEAKFYSLQKRSKLFIAGSVNFTPNFEDRDYTRKDPNMKVGIDFFFTPEKDGVIVVLSNRGNLRLIELSGRLTNTQNEIFDLWYNIAQTTDKSILHTTIWESFKLSSLNEQFYRGMVNSFTSLTQHLQENDTEEQIANQFANRLLGRLLFLWFLRKKNIINESKEYFNLGDQDDNKYYASKLNVLFFNVLNNESHKDFDPITPYLNGGLFDQNSDGEYWKNNKPTFPIGFFKKLYDHFDSFNFTTDESTPEYEQIAIDPEMLGRIFESFLATLKTETGAQAKKANGAFYTPREIVSYMSRESLRQYLYTVLDADNILKTSIDDLLDLSNSNWALAGTNSKRDAVAKEDRKRIIDALLNIKVLDPAVGSGAFPMGILHKIISLFERLEPNFDPYETKLSILKNNIYGVDIDPKAIEISRLRAWLSIIVDIKDVKKIKPLPNLEFKFVCANSLIGLDSSKQMSLTSDTHLKSTLIRIRDEYYATSNKKLKEKLQKEYIELTHPGQSAIFDTEKMRQLKSYQPFEIGKSASFYDPELMHGVASFDIVIGNPPYVEVEKEKYWIENYSEVLKGHYDLYIFFYKKGIELLSKNGVLSFITPHTFLSYSQFENLRKFIIKKIKIIECTSKISSIFKHAVVDNAIFIGKNTEEKIKTKFSQKIINNGLINVDYIEIDSNLVDSNTFEFELLKSYQDLNIIKKKTIPLGEIVDSSQGITVYAKIQGEKINYISKEKQTANSQKVTRGKEISKYYLDWSGDYIEYGDWLWCQRNNKFFEQPKIFLRQTSDKIIATFIEEPFYCIDSVHSIIKKDNNYSLFYILGILNSSFANYIYKKLTAESGKVFAQVKLTKLRSLPIPAIDSKNITLVEKIENLVNKILTILKIDSKTNIEDFEDQINNLVYKLYGLSEEEIKIVKNQ